MSGAIISADKSVDNGNQSVNKVGCVRMDIACRVDVYRWRTASMRLYCLRSVSRGVHRGLASGGSYWGLISGGFVHQTSYWGLISGGIYIKPYHRPMWSKAACDDDLGVCSGPLLAFVCHRGASFEDIQVRRSYFPSYSTYQICSGNS